LLSEKNVEIVRERYGRFIGAGENPADWDDPEFVWDMSTFAGWPEKQHYRGVAGMEEFLSNWLEPWDDWRLELEGLRQVDNDRGVLAICRQYGRSSATGLDTEMRFAQVWTLRGGRYVRMEMYAEPEQALEVTGLGRGFHSEGRRVVQRSEPALEEPDIRRALE
jgi:ketosteroid isomerase-like protein